MHIEQRHVTTVNLHDGKPRDFAICREARGCKVSAVARDEVLHLLLSPTDFQKLCLTILQPNGHDPRETPSAAVETNSAVSETTTPGLTTIRVDQRQVATVALHPSRPREFHLAHDDRGYKLSAVSKDDVVTLLLTPADFARLRQQALKGDNREPRRETVEVRRDGAEPKTEHVEVRRDPAEVVVVREPHEARRPVTTTTTEVCEAAYPWSSTEWLGFN